MAIAPSPDRRRPQVASVNDLLNAIQAGNQQLAQLLGLLPGLVHQKAVPLKIYALAASGSQNKMIVGSLQSRRVTNIQLDSTQLSSGGFKLRQIWEGFDTDQPWLANMSTVNITVAFDESADPVNEVITIPPNFVWFQGMMFPVTFSTAVANSLNFRADNADDQAATTTAIDLLTLARMQAWDGGLWDRIYTGSATNLITFSGEGSIMVSKPGIRATTHIPAVNTIATTTVAAGAAGVRHVCDSIQASLTSTALLAGASTALVVLRDGATGAGTIIRQWELSLSTTAGITDRVNENGLGIVGSAATAMTLEFTTAGGANTQEIVNLGTFDAT
jgi:hypothetical protein